MGSAYDLAAAVTEIRNRWPTVGLAFGVVRGGRLEAFHAQGLADIASARPITEDTVFRIGSLTKTFTGIAIMQLWEAGRVDLDAPANHYLRAFKLVPGRPGFRPATVRHLLTHSAGIREVLHLRGLLQTRRVLGEAIPAGRPVPRLAEYYRGGLRIDLDPGTAWMYTNHGFATLGQIVEDVTGEPLHRYFREHIFEPLGMDSTDLVRSERVRARLATGYELRSRGAQPVDCELITAGAGGIYSSPRDMARYLAALLGGGANEHGSALEPKTLASMYEAHYRPDPRLPGMGLTFWRGGLAGHPTVEHSGIVPGFDSQILLAPGDGVGVMAFANGARQGMFWLVPEAARVLRRVLDLPEDTVRDDLPHHPEIWGELCGTYRLLAARTDAAKLSMGLGVQVFVRRGRLTFRVLSPIPALCRGRELHPDDPEDPYVFRTEFPLFGGETSRAVFSRDAAGDVDGLHFDLAPMSFRRQGTPNGTRRLTARASP
ncbi:MAG TPA: serine hydrolase domain-containing protein [Candidatus Dormibacteraeota bacterium]|nr:serine hydrolase domain-containing protein [Candidatus Dormibacteraeota bacterium]